MITSYSVENFKQLQHISINFNNLNIIIGPNSAGKSSLLQSMDFLKAFTASSVDFYLERKGIQFNEIFNKHFHDKISARNKIKWDIKIQLDEHSYHYEVSITKGKLIQETISVNNVSLQDDEQPLLIRKGQKYFVRKNGKLTEGDFLNPNSGFLASITKENALKNPELFQFKSFIDGIKTFLIWDPNVLRNRSRGTKEELGDNGQNLATVISDMRKNENDRFQKMILRLQKIIPSLEDITVKISTNGWKEIILHEKVGRGVLQFSRSQISDGTLRLIAIACMRYSNNPHTLISFEEPENGVHPPVLKEAVSMIEELTQLRKPNKYQVFMTTHNPYLLDLFSGKPENIFVMEKNPKTGADLFQLPENAIELAKMLFNNSMGDLWLSEYLFDKEVRGE